MRPSRRLGVALAGGGLRAASVLEMLRDVEAIHVAVVLAENALGPAVRLADELGLFATCDQEAVLGVKDIDIVIDVSDGTGIMDGLRERLPERIEILGPVTAELVWDLLAAKAEGQEREREFADLQMEFDRNRGQERRLHASKTALEGVNAELESRLSEIYFTHEFFKALTRYTSVDDVSSLVVDGLNGVLGAEISCVYLFNRDDWTLRLRASQGRNEEVFRAIVPVGETILGSAYNGGPVSQPETVPGSPDGAWIDRAEGVCSQAAVPLVSGENVFGVVVCGFTTPRELSEHEMERFVALGNQASLSLQNALLLTELERLSVTDRLTQLYNHGYFQQRLEEEFNRSSRFGHPMSLIMIDIDDFKIFNDRYGHPRGDDALRVVSSVIRSCLRDMDIAARYGGEEFVVVLPETDRPGAAAVAERIRSDIAAQRVLTEEFGALACTVSIGVAAFPEHAATAARLVESADRALYRAKRVGKNRVETASA